MQEPARALLANIACHPLTITLLAGVVRQRARRCSANEVWRSLLVDWEMHLDSWAGKDIDSQYKQPLLAYKLSYEGLKDEERHLVDVLRFFPPAVLTPAAALELVWCQCTPAVNSQRGFADLLDELVDANIVEQHPFSHHYIESNFPGALFVLDQLLKMKTEFHHRVNRGVRSSKFLVAGRVLQKDLYVFKCSWGDERDLQIREMRWHLTGRSYRYLLHICNVVMCQWNAGARARGH
jgi:hypothetical protein